MLELVLVALAGGALFAVVVPIRAAPFVALLSVAAAAAAALVDVRRVIGGAAPEGLGGMLRLDAAGTLVLLLVLTLGFSAALASSQTERWPQRFYALLLAFTGTMALAAMADNLGLL